MSYFISRQAAIDALMQLPSAKSDIIQELAIDYLYNIGWMQEHDRILTESRMEAQDDLHGED